MFRPDFEANFSYIVPRTTAFSEIACGVFEGLLKPHTLGEANPSQVNDPKVDSKLHVPLKCACPDNFTSSDGVKYLVTYPLREGDGTLKLGKKFGIPPDTIWVANHLVPRPTVYPNTSLLVPLRTVQIINPNVTDSQPPTPGFLPTISVENSRRNTKSKNLYIIGSAVLLCLLLIAVLLAYCGFYFMALNKGKGEKLQSFTARSSPVSPQNSTNSCLSPDLLAGIKYSLHNYSIEELREATREFSEDTKIDDCVYKGLMDNVEVMIKQMRFEDHRHIIHIHSKIHHINIIDLQGICHGTESDCSLSYHVFEFPSNGCLRECLSNSSSPLGWHQRTQIAFDIATGLHYLHYYTVPSHVHLSINSRSIFVTANWRAKLANFGSIPAVELSKGNGTTLGLGGWIAPEFLLHQSAVSAKVDIFAFGVVLLELISARVDTDGKVFKDSIGYLGGAASEGDCFELLRSFMDPWLEEDYPLAEALCLAVLAKACVEDDPLHRPSMDDIMKVLARMV